MTIHYPDIYSGQAGMSFSGAPIAMVKATEGTGYVNLDFGPAKARAAAASAYFAAYHFLLAGNGAGQADHAFNIVGGIPLMLDFEVEGASRPSMRDALDFIDRYRSHGGVCNLIYFPEWYWQQLGRPDCNGLITRGMALVSSNYTSYSDTGPGWNPYGGMFPAVWQYTSSASFNGFNPVDFNAYRGTLIQWVALAGGLVTMGAQGPSVTEVQNMLNAKGGSLAADGVCGQGTTGAIQQFQSAAHLVVDGIVGQATMAALKGGPTPSPTPTPLPPFNPTVSQKAGDMLHISVTAPDGKAWKGTRTFLYTPGQAPVHIVDVQTEDNIAKVMPAVPVTWDQYAAWGGQ
jgi:GH25 family lysozyme M1 (1,4-beta-N-acetylmuramidase)